MIRSTLIAVMIANALAKQYLLEDFAEETDLHEHLNNNDTDLTISYKAAFNRTMRPCGEAFIKLFPRDYTTNLSGSFSPQDVPFVLAFGPDTCGHVHVMMNRYKLGKSVTAPEDNLAHRYSLLLFSSGSYRVHIDGRCVANGLVSTDFVLMDKLVKDPIARKPSNWIDDEFITDSSASTSPEFIDDAKSMYYDSRFMSSPKTKNPDHKEPTKIVNPAYQGPWVHPTIANPYYRDDGLGSVSHHICRPCVSAGFCLGDVRAGTFVDEVFISDSSVELSASEAYDFMSDVYFPFAMLHVIHTAEMRAQKAEEDAFTAMREVQKLEVLLWSVILLLVVPAIASLIVSSTYAFLGYVSFQCSRANLGATETPAAAVPGTAQEGAPKDVDIVGAD